MDVVCGRCRAEYEFDDALISERGTTVRCTSCGLQFKIFPPMGQRSPEVWRLFEPGVLSEPYAEYSSLSRLQKAIARGQVSPHHLLARGSEPPRALAEIVELQPLLGQTKSERPPPVEAQPAPRVTAGQSTALGIGMRPDPGQAPDAEPELDDPFEPDAEIVPASIPPNEMDDDAVVPASPGSSQRDTPTKPKIRSALSMTGGVTPAIGDSPPASISPRTPLRSALMSSPASSVPPSSDPGSDRRSSSSRIEAQPESSRRGQSVPSSRRGANQRQRPTPEEIQSVTAYPPGPPSSSDPDLLVADSATAETHSDDPPSSAAPSSFAGGASQPAKSGPSASANDSTGADDSASASDPAAPPAATNEKNVESRSAPRQEPSSPHSSRAEELAAARASIRSPTPTPLGLKSYDHPEAQSAKSRPTVPPERRARSAWIVAAVVVSSATFIAVSNRDKWGVDSTGAPSPHKVPAESKATAQDLERARNDLWDAEFKWLEPLVSTQGQDAGPLSLSATRVSFFEPDSWERVDALRLSGQLEEARGLAHTLSPVDGPLSLALLDLAEAPDDPPWPLLERRLKEAAAGEKYPYLARSLLIYTLLSSEHPTSGRAEFESFERLPRASEAPLFDELAKLAEQVAAEPPATVSDDDEPEPPPESPPAETEAPKPIPPAPDPAPRPEADPAPAARPAPEPAPPPKKDIPPEVRQKVQQADNLWRGGNRDAALVLYRQVVAQIGTSHFLGVRASSRIRQAEREKAEQK